MNCARCDSVAEEMAGFCTECGARLPPESDDVDPIQVGNCAPAVSATGTDSEVVEDITVPITGTAELPSDADREPEPGGQPEGPRPEPAQPRGLVTEMGIREKATWLDDVWGLPDDRADFGPVGS